MIFRNRGIEEHVGILKTLKFLFSWRLGGFFNTEHFVVSEPSLSSKFRFYYEWKRRKRSCIFSGALTFVSSLFHLSSIHGNCRVSLKQFIGRLTQRSRIRTFRPDYEILTWCPKDGAALSFSKSIFSCSSHLTVFRLFFPFVFIEPALEALFHSSCQGFAFLK